MRAPLTLIAIAAALLAGCGDGDDRAADTNPPVTLALDFQPNAVHAGVFTALDRDFDARHGLRLKVRAPATSTDSLKLLASGRSDFSIVDIHDLGLARERGQDVVGIGAIVQRPLAAVVASPKIRRPRDLEGKRVGVTGLPSDDAVLDSVVTADGGDPRKVRRITIGFSAVPSLAAGKVAAVVTFWNAEGVALKRRGVRTREFRVDDFGAPRYPELVLATKRSTLRKEPRRARALVASLAEGTREAAADLPRASARMARHTGGGDNVLTLRQLRAVIPAFRPALTLSRPALDGWARFDSRFGILKRRPDVSRAFWLP